MIWGVSTRTSRSSVSPTTAVVSGGVAGAGGGAGLALAAQTLLCQGDEFDHAFISLARAVAQGEDAVLEQDQSFDLGIAVENVRYRLGQRETGHHIGHVGDAIAINRTR